MYIYIYVIHISTFASHHTQCVHTWNHRPLTLPWMLAPGATTTPTPSASGAMPSCAAWEPRGFPGANGGSGEQEGFTI